jgi:hypothetical protein
MGLRKVSHVDQTFPGNGGAESRESTASLLRELVAHLRENRTPLREEWVRRITEMSHEESRCFRSASVC